MADHREPPHVGIAVMAVSLTGMGEAFRVGQILAEQVVGLGAENQVGCQVPMKNRDHIEPRSKGQRHADRSRFVSDAGGNGPLGIAFLEELEEPLVHPPGKIHPAVGHRVEILPVERSRVLPRRRSGFHVRVGAVNSPVAGRDGGTIGAGSSQPCDRIAAKMTSILIGSHFFLPYVSIVDPPSATSCADGVPP